MRACAELGLDRGEGSSTENASASVAGASKPGMSSSDASCGASGGAGGRRRQG